MTHSFSDQSSMRVGAEHPGSVVWYISFGDLLTLLLCFFLVLTPWSKAPSGRNDQSQQTLTGQHVATSQSGTTFASAPSLKGSVLLSEIPVFERDWLASIGDSKDVPGLMMDTDLRSLRGRVSRASLLVCHTGIDRSRALQRWGEVVQSVLGDQVRLEFVVTGSCRSADIRLPATEKVVGRVRLLGT